MPEASELNGSWEIGFGMIQAVGSLRALSGLLATADPSSFAPDELSWLVKSLADQVDAVAKQVASATSATR